MARTECQDPVPAGAELELTFTRRGLGVDRRPCLALRGREEPNEVALFIEEALSVSARPAAPAIAREFAAWRHEKGPGAAAGAYGATSHRIASGNRLFHVAECLMEPVAI